MEYEVHGSDLPHIISPIIMRFGFICFPVTIPFEEWNWGSFFLI